MFKSAFAIGCLAFLSFAGIDRGWASEDLEDRFLNPEISVSKNIFLDVKNASLVDVLKIISKQTGLSFIADQDVEDRKVTLYLNQVPLNQALQTILDANNLTYQMQEGTDVFVVMKKWETARHTITKVYQLKYATVSSSLLNSTLSLSSKTSGGIEDAVKDALTDHGKVIEDPRTNSLIISDVPSQFPIIESAIARLDVPVPQVLIEVEMLDVSKSVADQLGITYGATPLTFTGGSKFSNWPFGASTGGSSSSTSSSSSSSSTTTGWSANGMTAALNYLTTDTDARTLARPRILTLNNETAQIQISTDQAISIEETSTSTTSTSAQTTFTPERYTTGVILKVTPQANLLTREITMAVSPKVIDVILSQVQPPAGSSQGQIYDPETRGSDSILKLKDGQSMVIGGLMTNQISKTLTKLPVLGDLPVVGTLFRSTNRQKEERELLIFLTPHIIDGSNQTALADNTSLSSGQAALDMQKASDRAQEISNSLNSFDSK